MRISKKLAALGAFFVLAAVVAGCGSSIPGNSVASVAGNPITLQAFKHWSYVAVKESAAQAEEEGESEPVVVPNDPPDFNGCIKQMREQVTADKSVSASSLRKECSTEFTEVKSEVMDFLIEGYWYQAEGHRLKIKSPHAQVQKTIKEYEKEAGSTAAFTEELQESGETLQDLEFTILVNDIYADLVKRATKKVTPASIAQYYDKHKSEFGTKESADVHLIPAKTQSQAKAALAALKAGQSWSAVAKKYASTTSAKSTGGLLTDVPSGEEEQVVNKAIFSGPKGKLQGPIHGEFAWYVLEVNKITPATQESLKKATAEIKELMSSSAETDAKDAVNKVAKQHWGKQTQCRSTYAVSLCANYVAPKTTATTSSTVTPTTSTKSSTASTKSSSSATTTGSKSSKSGSKSSSKSVTASTTTASGG